MTRPIPLREWAFYVAVGAGMAISNAAFAMVSGLFELVPAEGAFVALVLAAAVAFVIALSIGELAGMWPSSPAVLTYFRAGYGPAAALVLIHAYLLFVVLIAGVESYSFAMVVRAAWPAIPPAATIVALLTLVVLVNLRGLELSRLMQIVTAFGSMGIVVAAGLAGVATGPQPLASAPSAAGWGGLPAAVALAVFIYTGFEWVTPVGLSRHAYARAIPRSMLIAIALLLVMYGALVLGLGAVLPRGVVAASAVPQVLFMDALIGRAGVAIAVLVSLGAIFSTFNAGIMGGAQLLQAMAREGTLPRWVGWVNISTGAPIGAVLLLGSLALVSSLGIAAFHLYLVAGLIGSAIICLIYAFYVGAVVRLRRSAPDHPRPFAPRVPAVLRWAIIVLMPAIGAASLFSIPALATPALAGFAGACLLVALLAMLSARLKRGSVAAVAARLHGAGR